MPSVTRAAFLQPAARRIEQVPLPEAGPGAYVCVRQLGARELRQLRARARGEEADLGNLGFAFALFAVALTDDAGAPLWDSAEDVAEGFDLPLPALERLAGEVMRVSGLTVTEKNSPPRSATSSP